MWLAPFFDNPALQDAAATIITLAVSLVWLRSMDALAHRGLMPQQLSRKIIHIGTGPLFVLCWNLFSPAEWARYTAALVPLGITVQFVAVGLGWMQDEAAVKAMTRSGDRREILRGPLFYGVVFVTCTVLFWHDSPLGILALMMMCGGDGLADVVGRRFGTAKLPFNRDKSWAGSAAMLAGSLVFGYGFVALFSALGYFPLPAFWPVAGMCLAVTLVEMLPVRDWDNVTITLTALGLGALWL